MRLARQPDPGSHRTEDDTLATATRERPNDGSGAAESP